MDRQIDCTFSGLWSDIVPNSLAPAIERVFKGEAIFKGGNTLGNVINLEWGTRESGPVTIPIMIEDANITLIEHIYTYSVNRVKDSDSTSSTDSLRPERISISRVKESA